MRSLQQLIGAQPKQRGRRRGRGRGREGSSSFRFAFPFVGLPFTKGCDCSTNDSRCNFVSNFAIEIETLQAKTFTKIFGKNTELTSETIVAFYEIRRIQLAIRQ